MDVTQGDALRFASRLPWAFIFRALAVLSVALLVCRAFGALSLCPELEGEDVFSIAQVEARAGEGRDGPGLILE